MLITDQVLVGRNVYSRVRSPGQDEVIGGLAWIGNARRRSADRIVERHAVPEPVARPRQVALLCSMEPSMSQQAIYTDGVLKPAHKLPLRDRQTRAPHC